tara:strand:- start:5786 stop:6691 length:906 start_codon:yes stop_codon:yes gene_type:complete
MNFLYCFDNNFNLQALNSINSIIKYSKNANLNFYIIHDSPKTFLKILDKYLPNHKHLIEIYKFDFDSIKFPRINKAHVTKATYFRLFFQKYLPKNIEFITYVDSDIICLSDPENKINELIRTIDDDNLLIGAVSDGSQVIQNINRLGIKSDKYFNAGVMIINLKQWSKKIDISEIILCMEKLKDKIKWWDQDVLNVLVDGNFLELKNDFNMKVSDINGMPDKSVVFLHYSGKGKPWDNSFFKDSRVNFYQNAFLRTGFSQYHIDPKGIKENILFFKYLFSNKYKQFDRNKLLNSYIKNKFK